MQQWFKTLSLNKSPIYVPFARIFHIPPPSNESFEPLGVVFFYLCILDYKRLRHFFSTNAKLFFSIKPFREGNFKRKRKG